MPEKTPEEIAAEEEAQRKADEEAAQQEAEAKRAEDEREAAEKAAAAKEWEGDVDKEKAERAVRNAREAEKKAKARADAAEARARELEQAQETEHETAKRERDEARAEADRLRANNERVTIDVALRDAASDAGISPKKVRRAVRMADRDEITVDADGQVDGAIDAIEALLEEFPEFKEAPANPDDGPLDPEPPGGSPDRKRSAPKEMTREQVQKLAAEDIGKFNELFDAGKIPASALSAAPPKK